MTHAEIVERFEAAALFANQSRFRRLLSRPIGTVGRFIAARLMEAAGLTYKTTAALFWGKEVKVVFPESISNLLLYQGFLEEDVTRFFLENLGPGQVLIDVGAHIGYHALLGAFLTGEAGAVHAFEPTFSTFELLKENTADSGNVFARNLGLWNEEAVLEINDFGLGHSSFNTFFSVPRSGGVKFAPVKVKVTTLDAYCAGGIRPDLIKIDAESSELKVLEGGKQTIKKFRPAIVMEVGGGESRSEMCNAAVEFLLGLGYGVFRYENNAFVPHRFSRQNYFGHENLFFIHPSVRQ
jgi:FkbM family methyltransferase